jgi:ABC-type dipeptide/oligopeptide/nickel transport system permease subunit
MNTKKVMIDISHGWDNFKRKSRLQIKKTTQVIKVIRREPRGMIGASIIGLILLCAIFSPLIAPYDPNEQEIVNRFAEPSSAHLLGTDYLGRDILSRLIYGARAAAIVSVCSVGIAVLIGVPLGAVAAYNGGIVDYLVILIFDVIRSFPSVIMILVLAAIFGPSLLNIILILAFTSFPAYGRVARAQTLCMKEEESVLAAKSLGASTGRILLKHITPNILSPIIVLAGMDLAVMIMWESALSFLGLGLQPPAASWGIMLKQGYTYIETAPLMIIWPAVVLITTMLGCSLFAEVLRVALNPKERVPNE